MTNAVRSNPSDPDIGAVILTWIQATAALSEIVSFTSTYSIDKWFTAFHHPRRREVRLQGGGIKVITEPSLAELTRDQPADGTVAWSHLRLTVEDPAVGDRTCQLGMAISDSRELIVAERLAVDNVCRCLRLAIEWRHIMGDVNAEAYAAMMQPLNHGLAQFGKASCATVVATIAPAVDAINKHINAMLEIEPPTVATPEVNESGGVDI